MAKTNGIIKIEGTIEDLTFYKKDGKNFVRRKGGVSKERIETDPNFVRTRENNSEFSMSGGAGKLLRKSLGTMVFKAKDSKISSRMLQVMSFIKNEDTISPRGKRNVFTGLGTTEGKAHLKGFDFNNNAPFSSVFSASYTLDVVTGTVTIASLITAEQLVLPQGATHVSFQSAASTVNFETGNFETVYSNVETVPINLTPTTITLTPASVPSGGTIQLFALLIYFSQEVNGTLYPLKNQEFNVLNLLEVV